MGHQGHGSDHYGVNSSRVTMPVSRNHDIHSSNRKNRDFYLFPFIRARHGEFFLSPGDTYTLGCQSPLNRWQNPFAGASTSQQPSELDCAGSADTDTDMHRFARQKTPLKTSGTLILKFPFSNSPSRVPRNILYIAPPPFLSQNPVP